jgi:hypothetical protein
MSQRETVEVLGAERKYEPKETVGALGTEGKYEPKGNN